MLNKSPLHCIVISLENRTVSRFLFIPYVVPESCIDTRGKPITFKMRSKLFVKPLQVEQDLQKLSVDANRSRQTLEEQMVEFERKKMENIRVS